MAAKEIPPLRVWLLALVILVILIALGAALFVVLDGPLTFIAGRGDFGPASSAVTAVSSMLPSRA